MGFADRFSQRLRENRRRGRLEAGSTPSQQQVEAADPGEGYLTSALLAPLRIGRAALDAIDVADSTTRAGIGALLGIEGTGRATIFGNAPSGRELLGLGEGERGTFESGDVPGFLAEVVASPLNLVGLGGLSKAGRAAQALDKVSAAEKAYRAAGRIAEADSLLPRLTALTDELTRSGAATAYGKTLAEQGKLGQRSLLSLDLPGVAALPLLPRSVNEKGLGLIGSTYERLIGAPLRPLYNAAFRPAGKIGNAQFDTLVDVAAREGTREGARAGQAAGVETEQRLAKLGTTESDVAGVAKRLDDRLNLAKRSYRARYGKDLPPRIERQLRLSAGLENEALTPGQRLTLLGAEHTGPDIAGKVDKQIAEINTQLADRLARIDKQIADWNVLGTAPWWLVGRRTKAMKAAARRIFPLATKKSMSAELLTALPPDVATEVGRLAAISGQELAAETAAGVRVTELTDPLLSYVYHSVSPAGRQLADNLLKLGVQDDDALRVVRTFVSEPDFTKRRTEALRGLGILQSNDWLGEQALDKAGKVLRDPLATATQRKAAQNVLDLVNKGGRFFEENPGVAVLRRLTSGGEAQGNARLLQGVVNLFAVDKAAAGPNARPVEDFLEQAGIGKLGQTDLPRSAAAIRKTLKGTQFEGQYIPVEYHQAALQTSKVLRDPEELRGALRLYGQITSLHRAAATSLLRPGYFVRNALGNAFNMHLAGFRSPRHLVRAYDILRREGSGSLNAGERRLLDRAIELGAIDSGSAAEVRQLTKEAGLLGESTRWQRAGGKVIDAGLAINRRLENTSKLALLLDGRARGLSDVEAAERVKKYLFDYTDLSPVEKKYLRRMAFFYSFARFNLPLQVEAIVRNPRTLRLYGLATGRLGESIQKDLLPQWQQNQGLISTGRDEESGRQNFVSLGLPMEDLFRYDDEGGGLARSGQKIAQNLSPLLKLPIEGMTGVSIQTGLPIRQRASEQAVASLLPPDLAQDASLLMQAESAAPTAAISGLLRRAAEIDGQNRTGSGLLSSLLTGVTPVSVERSRAQALKLREAAARAKRRLERGGVSSDDPRVKLLNRALRTERR